MNATDCVVAPVTSLPATFSFQTTNPATNQLIGTLNTAVNVAAGVAQSFVIGITPTVTIYTFFFAALAHAAAGRRAEIYAQLIVPIALLLAVTLVPQLVRARRRRERLAALRAQRAARRGRAAAAESLPA